MTAKADRRFSWDGPVEVTRREMIGLVGALAVAPIARLAAQPATPPIKVTLLSHVGLTVADFTRTIEFYQRIFGMTVLTWQGPPAYPTPGETTGVEYPLLGIEEGRRPQLLVLSGGRGGRNSSVNHFSLGVENWDVPAIVKILEANGVKGRVRMREGKTPEILFNDPDGILFQLQHVSYCGGSGPLGDNCDPKVRPFPKGAPGGRPPARPPLRARTLNHFGISAVDMKRSFDFYQKLFAFPIQTYQGDTAVLTLGTGPRPQFIEMSQGNIRDGKLVAPPTMTAGSRLSHYCIGVDNFDPDRVVKTLVAEGVKADVTMREGRIPEVYFWDPDNIRVQVQDARYCGGSGPLGNLCDEKSRPLADAKRSVAPR